MSGTDERHALGVQKRSSATPASFGYMSRLWGLVGAVQVDRGGESAGVVAFGMFVMHAVVQNMYRVSEKLVLKPLHVAPHCWWSASRSRSRPGSCAHSKRGLGRPSAFDADVTSNYLEIIYDSEFVESLAVTLEALEPPGPAEPDGTSHHSAIDAHRPLTSHTP